MSSKISLLGCGWLGQPLTRHLQASGFEVVGTVSSAAKQERLAQLGIETLVWRLGSAVPNDFFRGDTLIITLPPGSTQDDDAGKVYANGLVEVVEEGKTKGLKKVLYTSSTSVYGDVPGPIDESAPLLGGRRSAQKVIAAETSLRLVEGIRLTVLRLSGLVGGSRQPGKWFAGKKDVPNGNAKVNLVHRQDVIQVVHEVIRQDAWGHTLNVCADEHPTKAEYYPEMARQLGLEVPTFIPSPNPDSRLVLNAHLKSILNYNFAYPDPRIFPRDTP